MRFLSLSNDQRQMSVLEHLEELRGCLMRSMLALIVGTCIGFFLAKGAIDLLLLPISQSGLLHPHAGIAHIEVQPDGTFRFTNLNQIAALPDTAKPGQEAAPAHTETIRQLEFFLPGAEKPFATFASQERTGVAYLRPTDPFAIQFKAALVIGLLLALPVMLYQIYVFIAPGLYPHERRAILPLFWMAVLLFPVGAAFAWYLLKYALIFFAGYASDQAFLFNDIRAYLGFVLMTMLSFGAVFELPVVVLLLMRLGLVSVETLSQKRKIVFVVLMIISAVVTPTGDPVTLMAMTLPLYLLFEFSLFLARLQARQNAARERAEAAAQGSNA